MLFLHSRLTSNDMTKLTNAGFASLFHPISQLRLDPEVMSDLILGVGGQNSYLLRIPEWLFDLDEGLTQGQVKQNKPHNYFLLKISNILL